MPWSRRAKELLGQPGAATAIALIALLIVFAILSPHFLTWDNIKNLLVQSVFVLLIAVGMTFVLITGAIDLSVGSVAGLSAGVSIWVGISGGGFVLALLAGIAVGVVVGLLNGLIINRFQISDFIVTLGTLSVTEGALTLLASARSLQGYNSGAFSALANNDIMGIPVAILIAAVFVVGLQILLGHSLFGRKVFATGISSRAARLAGMNVDGVRLGVFVLSGTMAAVAGVLLASQLSSVQSGLGQDLTLQAIAAAVVGGTSLAGGSGSVTRAVVGALFLGTLSNGLQLLSVSSSWYTVFVGVSLVAAMALDEAVRTFLITRVRGTGPTPLPWRGEPTAATRPSLTEKEVS